MSIVCGVGHAAFGRVCDEPQSLSDMRRPDARSRDTDRSEGVSFTFQVSLNKIEPSVPNRRFNLFTKDCVRAALADEIEPDRPQVALVCRSFSFAGGTEGLAGAASGPDATVVRPAGEPECV